MALRNFNDLSEATEYVALVGHTLALGELLALDANPNKSGSNRLVPVSRRFLETALANAEKAEQDRAEAILLRANEAAEQSNRIAEKALDAASRSSKIAIASAVAAAISAGAALYPVVKGSAPVIIRSEPIIIHVPVPQTPSPPTAPGSESTIKEKTRRNAQERPLGQ